MHVEFAVDPTVGRADEITGRATFSNASDEPADVPPMRLDSASLALEVVDATGTAVPPPPPPLPDPLIPPHVLTAGGSYAVTYPGFLPSWTEPGHYRVRARPVGADGHGSDWVDVTVTT